jgi:hypothetical protein
MQSNDCPLLVFRSIGPGLRGTLTLTVLLAGSHRVLPSSMRHWDSSEMVSTT